MISADRTISLLVGAEKERTAAGRWKSLPAQVVSQLGALAETLPKPVAGPRSLALVSPGRREGTSTCTLNLGRALAERGKQVLVVDANAQNPALHDMTAVAGLPGLAEVLRGDVACAAAIQPTSLPNLSVMSAGRVAVEGIALPAVSGSLRERVLDQASSHEFVLVDCAAVNVFEDAARTAAQCDGVIIVLQAGRTMRQEAHAAKRILSRANCNLLGLFLNRRKFYIPQFIYDRL
jgi:protein-tyrosine kinase